jgi:hypothetical protein
MRVLSVNIVLSLATPGTPAVRNGICNGPIQPHLRFGTNADRSMAKRICCHNHEWAEPSGYFLKSRITLVSTVEAQGSTDHVVFYDSTCGLPLFRIKRTTPVWLKESTHHGWPSFRPNEAYHENIQFKDGGEVVSKCGTHLGHNIPDEVTLCHDSRRRRRRWRRCC